MLKIGDVVKIRNRAGLLNVTLLRKLNMRDVIYGFDGGLGKFENTRLEFHERRGDKMITIYDNCDKNEKIFLIFNLDSSLDVEIWEGSFPEYGEDEEFIFATKVYE